MQKESLKNILKRVKENEVALTLLSGFLFVVITATIILSSIYIKSKLQGRRVAESGDVSQPGQQIEVTVGDDMFIAPEYIDQNQGTVEPKMSPSLVQDSYGQQQKQNTKSVGMYRVQPGESLWSIAEKKYGNGEWYIYLAQVNGLSMNELLEVGQELYTPIFEKTISLPRIPANQHLVRSGQSLSSIAQQRLGDSSEWVQIYSLNRELIGSNPDLIFPRMVLRLPDTCRTGSVCPIIQ